MSTPGIQSNDHLLSAATLAFVLLRFETPAAHPSRGATLRGVPSLGEQAYLFSPSWRFIPNADVPAFLAGLASPALLSPTTTRGVIALTLVSELSGEREAWATKTLTNQAAVLERMVQHLIPIAILRSYSERFA
jgi:hypothetical protein